MYGLLQILSVSRSVILGGQNVGAYREPDKEVDNEIDQCAGGTHRRQKHHCLQKRPTTTISAALNSSCKMPGKAQGDGKADKLPSRGPFVMSIS